jgi:hypothetical protein
MRRVFDPRRFIASLARAALAIGSTAAFAYRPFDATDAAVADANEVEIRVDPSNRLRVKSPNRRYA